MRYYLFFFFFILCLVSPGGARELEDRTNHVFGFIPKESQACKLCCVEPEVCEHTYLKPETCTHKSVKLESCKHDYVEILDATTICPDLRLEKPGPEEHHELKITLDRFELSDYPGWGKIHLFFAFSAQDQRSMHGQSLDKAHFEALKSGMTAMGREISGVEELESFYKKVEKAQQHSQPVQYARTHEIREGDGLATNGYPIFIGLRSGDEGAAFRVTVIHLKNDDDMDLAKKVTDNVKEGLNLLGPAGSLISTVTGHVQGIVQHIKNRNRNRIIQDVFLGLDHSELNTRAKLAEGSYIVVQIDHDPSLWNWDQWVFDRKNGQVVRKGVDRPVSEYASDMKGNTKKKFLRKMDFNYMVFGVSKMRPNQLTELGLKAGTQAESKSVDSVVAELKKMRKPYKVVTIDDSSISREWIRYKGVTYQDFGKVLRLLKLEKEK